MQEHTKKIRSRAAKLLGGALIGTVLSIGAVAGSASAGKAPTTSNGSSTTVVETSMSSGIRW